jgi:N-acetyl-gamma-glutamyl-phosphate reductase
MLPALRHYPYPDLGGDMRVQLIGATGYGGLGILELLLQHPQAEVATLVARDDAGQQIADIYPHLSGQTELVVQSPDDITIGTDCDIVVFATPDRVSMGYAATLANAGVRFLDYSGDFRFPDSSTYARYAAAHPSIVEEEHTASDLLARACYGLPELCGEALAAAPIVGNPGCFAVGITLGLAPLFSENLVEENTATVDSLTGSSGAGKIPSSAQHFSHLNDNVVPYRVLNHQHSVEAELTLGGLAGSPATLYFVPHLLGVTRGILSTMHLVLRHKVPREDLLDRYREFYKEAPFVRVLETPPTLKEPVGSNYCDISLVTSADERRVVVISSIDNLLKGQSGNALQNLNLMFGLEQTTGLERIPLYP